MKISYRKSLVMALMGLLLMLATGAYFQTMPEIAGTALLAAQNGYLLYGGENAPQGEKMFFSREKLYEGLLLRVSADTPLPEEMPVQQSRNVRKFVGLYIPTGEQVNLSEETIYALCDLVQENALLSTWIIDGMHAPMEQNALQKAAFEKYQNTLPLAEALAQAIRDVPDSGKSEHQLSTAFDLQLNGIYDWSQEDPMARSADGRWMLENAWRFGVIRRYPPEKRAITGVENETLHCRYVGKAHAAVMQTAAWCLEEYLDALHRYGTLRLVTPEGKTHWILCAPMQEKGAAFTVPAGMAAAPSADNTGYAVCVLSDI